MKPQDYWLWVLETNFIMFEYMDGYYSSCKTVSGKETQ